MTQFLLRYRCTDDVSDDGPLGRYFGDETFASVEAAYRAGRRWEDECVNAGPESGFIILDEQGNQIALPDDIEDCYISEWDRLNAHFANEERRQQESIHAQIPAHLLEPGEWRND